MSRDVNAPVEVPTPDDVSRELDRSSESNPHLRRTALGVDAELVRREAVIGEQTRRVRRRSAWCAWAVRGGAAAGYVALAIEVWRSIR